MTRNGKKQISVWVDSKVKERYELLTGLIGKTSSQDINDYLETVIEAHRKTIEKLEELQKKVDLEKSKLQIIENQNNG